MTGMEITDSGKVLVTGAAGFIGRAVCDRLIRRGVSVLATDMQPGHDPAVPVVQCDLTDVHRLYAMTEGEEIAAIIHCGAVSGPMLAKDNPRALINSNVSGTANILELARVRGIPRVILASSAAVFGQTPPGPVPEAVALQPSNIYAATKLASESLSRAYALQFGLDTVCLRLSWVYGPHRRTSCVIRTMLEDLQAARPTRLSYGEDFPRQFVYIDDAAGALVSALDRRALPQPVYTITGGEYVTLGELADIVRRLYPGADIRLAPGPAPEDDLQQPFDISAARRDIGYVPRTTLRDGIRLYANWLAGAPVPQLVE